jgi:hypothetical protein
VDALNRGAHVVITGRSTDTALTYAPMIHAFGWPADAWDRLAAGVVAGHINECGAQASGGNSLVAWQELDDLGDVGYPIIEAHPDGTFVVTKHDGTGGRVSVPVVAEQILYEMGDPRSYITPDVVADFTTIHLTDDGPDRVRVHGVRGRPATDKLKVSISYSAGYKATGTLVYAWPDAIEKARMADRVLRERLDRMGAASTPSAPSTSAGTPPTATSPDRRPPTCPRWSCASACGDPTAPQWRRSPGRSRPSSSPGRPRSPASPAAGHAYRRSWPTGPHSWTAPRSSPTSAWK